MKVENPTKKGVYLQFRDRQGKRKSETLTIDRYTPKQAMMEFAKFLRSKRKAG